MTAKFFAILTNQGAALLANATALGTKLNITQMAVGDGNGTLPTPDATQTKLVNQKRIAPLNMLSVDANNTSQIIAEQVIPENEGGFWIREIGLYDDNGVLIAVANCPETYKPQLQEGSGRTQTIRMVLIVSSTAAVTLKIDPSVVLATRKYVDDKAIEVKGYADNLLAQHISADNPHGQYAKGADLEKKQPLDGTLTNLSGKNVEGILRYLGLGEAAKREVGTGTSQIPDMSSFTSSKAGSGYQKLPSGLIIQWSTVIATQAGTTFTYPVSFPSRVLAIIPGMSNGDVMGTFSFGGGNLSGGAMYTSILTANISFIAIGY